MSNDLLSPTDLEHLPGSPFTPEEVDEAVASLRGELGWHVAPEKEETVTLDVTCGDPVLRLPTKRLVSVDEIRNVSTADVILATSYQVSAHLARVRRYSWPSGYGAVEVDMTHGFATCPPELRPIVAQMISSGRDGGEVVTQRTVGPFSESYSTDQTGDLTEGQRGTLERYSVRTSWPARL